MTRERATPPLAHFGGRAGPAVSSADERLEMAIESTRQALLGAKTREVQLELQEQMRQLITQRSPQQIAKMEQERGLAP